MEAHAGEYIRNYLHVKRFPRISLVCKLVPVQYQEYEYGLLNIPLFKTKTGQRSFSYRIVNIWNNLPSDEIKLSQCLNSFKRNLRKYLLKDSLR